MARIILSAVGAAAIASLAAANPTPAQANEVAMETLTIQNEGWNSRKGKPGSARSMQTKSMANEFQAPERRTQQPGSQADGPEWKYVPIRR
jgi:hypothetical protein